MTGQKSLFLNHSAQVTRMSNDLIRFIQVNKTCDSFHPWYDESIGAGVYNDNIKCKKTKLLLHFRVNIYLIENQTI